MAAPVAFTAEGTPVGSTPAGLSMLPPGTNATSLWVGDLDKDVNESQLFSVFNAIAPVVSLRICRDYATRASLGYAYVNFATHDQAATALRELNYTPIRNKPCRIMWSQRDPNNRKTGFGTIFVKNIPPSIDHKMLAETFSHVGSVSSARVAINESGGSRGYGYVTFESEKDAAAAVASMRNFEFEGFNVEVRPFVPKASRQRGAGWTNCYVKNIPKGWSDEFLREKFTPFGTITSCVIMRDKASHEGKGFGFVNFATKEEAEAAVEALNDLPIEEEPEAGAGASSSTSRKLFVGPHQTKSERSRELMKQFKERKNDQTKACNLYIKNLGDEVTDDDLRQKFAKYGSITSARIMRDTSGANKGFGFVCFSSTDEANKASAELHRSMWNGRPLYVAVAQRRDERAEQIMKTRTDRTQQSLAAGGLYRGATFAPVAGGAPGTAVAPGVGGVPANMNMNMMNQQFLSMLAMQMLMQQQQQQQQAVAAANAASGGTSQVPSTAATAGAPRPTTVAPGSTAVALAQPPRGAPQVAQAPRPFSQVARQPAPAGVAPTQQPPRGYIAAVRQPAAAAPAPRGVVAAGPRGAIQPGYTGAPRVMMPTAVPAMGRVAPAGGAPAGVPSILDVLRTADPATHRNILGERLFPLVRAHQPEKASKITGMLLEMGTSEVLHLLEDPAALDSRVREAVSVLQDGVRA